MEQKERKKEKARQKSNHFEQTRFDAKVIILALRYATAVCTKRTCLLLKG